MMQQISSNAEFNIPGEQKPGTDELQKLSQLIERYAPHEGTFDILDNCLHVVKACKSAAAESYTLSLPGICIITQGAKAVSSSEISFE